MRIWIDLANSPHVLFFAPLIKKFQDLGHETELTARDFSQTHGLLDLYGLPYISIGRHERRGLLPKLFNIVGRARKLRKWARKRRFDLAVSHNSYAQILAARMMGIRSVTLMDYEYQPANHLAFRLATRIVIPHAFSEKALKRYGARPKKVCRYNGLKEEVYLHGFAPDPDFKREFIRLFDSGPGYNPDEHLLFLLRPPATMSAYHRFENPLFTSLLRYLVTRQDVRAVLIPRTPEQCAGLKSEVGENVVMPENTLEGKNAVWHADAVISAGGTMCREAAVLGTTAFTIFRGKMGGVDSRLIDDGLLSELRSESDFAKLLVKRKTGRNTVGPGVLNQVIDYCLSLQEGKIKKR